jgi:tetratricopeptide (TPR) repeat protein
MLALALTGCATQGVDLGADGLPADPAERRRIAVVEYGHGVHAELQGDYDQAYRRFLVAAALAPDSPRVLREIGRVLLLCGQFEPAAGILERARALEPGTSAGLFELAEAYRRLGRIDQAVATLVEMHEHQPLMEEPLYLLHALLLLSQHSQRGLDLFTEVTTSVRPAWPFGYEALGDFWLQLDRPDAAEASYLRAIALGTEHDSVARKLELARRRAATDPDDAPEAPPAGPGLGVSAPAVPAEPAPRPVPDPGPGR